MTYIVKDECIKCKLTDCVEVCPVDCFYEGENMLVINPDECIDCGVCEPECPIDAIKADTDESVKDKETDIVISAGNTGALLVIAKLNLKMIENIDKPALSALWPNEKGMSVDLDLGAYIECSDKNLIEKQKLFF